MLSETKDESEGKKQTEEASLDALDWLDKHHLCEEDGPKTENVKFVIKTMETNRSEPALKDSVRGIRFNVMNVKLSTNAPPQGAEIESDDLR